MDDDEFLVNMYATKFEKEGYEVETATTSEEALSRLEEGEAPDIFIIDIIMPNISGLEVLERVKEKNLAPGTHAIMLTNQGGEEQIEKAKELGAAGYIVKATSIPSEVVEKVKEIEADAKKGEGQGEEQGGV